MEQEQSSTFSVLKASLPVLVVNALGLPLVLLLQVVLARVLGSEQYGIYEATLGVIAVLTLFSSFGADWYLLRQVPQQPNSARVISLAGWGAQLAFQGALSGAIVLASLALVAYFADYTLYAFSLVAGIPLLLFWAQNNIRQAVIRGLHAPASARFPDVVLRPILFIILVYLIVPYLKITSTAALVMLLHGLAALMVMFVGRKLLLSQLHKPFETLSNVNNSFSKEEKASAQAASKIMMWALVLLASSQELEKILLAVLSTPQEVAWYAFAARFALTITFVSETVNAALLPKIAQLQGEQHTGMLWKTYHRATLINVVGALFILLVVAVAAPYLAELASAQREAQQGFLSAVPLLILLSVVQVGVQALGPAAPALLMMDAEKKVLRIQITTIIVQVFVGILLIPYLGAYGAVYTQAIALFIRGWLARRALYSMSKQTTSV